MFLQTLFHCHHTIGTVLQVERLGGGGSIPNEVIGFFFYLPNPSSLTVALVFTQPLTELSTRDLPEG
jgi:hypothetical protein